MTSVKILILTAILIAGLSFNSLAQKRPEKTSSAKAYYGDRAAKARMKQNKMKVKNFRHTKPAKGTTSSDLRKAYRRKSTSRG